MSFWSDFLLRHRVDGPELLDEGLGSDAEARRSLDDLRRLNRFLFGTYATLRPLEGWVRDASKPVGVLELGTGSGQMAQALARWARRESQAVHVIALDLTPRHLREARAWNERVGSPQVALLGGNALALPLADGVVDFVFASLFVHHFDEAALAQLFDECRRVARRGLVMSDLWRHPLPYLLYKGAAEPLLVRSPITRVDSSASFRRAYRPHEIRRIASRSLPSPSVTLQLPSLRWVLTSRW